jgi:dihydroflavonol-4-reductase
MNSLNLKDLRVLVTGAAGFTGSYVVNAFLKHNVKVRALVRNTRIVFPNEVEIITGDITDREFLATATKNIDVVINIAALFREAGLPDENYFKVNRDGVRYLIEASINNGVKKFIQCSTNGVTSNLNGTPTDEKSPYSPSDIYQRSKMEGEIVALEYFRKEKIQGLIIRPAMIYGPSDKRLGKIFSMIKKGIFFYVGSGNCYVHWVDVRDLANAFVLATSVEGLNGQIFLIAGEKYLTLKESVNIIAEELNVNKPWLHLPVKPMQLLGSICEALCKPFGIAPPIYRRRVDFYTKHRAFNIEAAINKLGFKPAQDFRGEVKDIISDMC